jgi:hypothetical protein
MLSFRIILYHKWVFTLNAASSRKKTGISSLFLFFKCQFFSPKKANIAESWRKSPKIAEKSDNPLCKNCEKRRIYLDQKEH